MTNATLTTERMTLRCFTKEDAATLETLLGDDDVMCYSVIGKLSTQQIEKHLEGWMHHYEHYSYGIWAVVYEEQVIGFCGVDWKLVDGIQQIQLSYRFNKKYWGKGLAYEAARAVCDYALHKLAIKRIIALIDPENDKSIALAKKLGMVLSHETIYLGYKRQIYKLEA